MSSLAPHDTGSAPATGAPAPHGPRPGRRTVLLAAAVALVAVLAVVLAVAASRPSTTHDPGTPEGVVQAYLTAVVGGDSVAAAALLASGSPCTATDLDRAPVPTGTRVDLVGTQVTGDRALVRVLVSTDTLDPVSQGEERTLRLTRSADGWRVDGIPWPLFTCTGA